VPNDDPFLALMSGHPPPPELTALRRARRVLGGLDDSGTKAHPTMFDADVISFALHGPDDPILGDVYLGGAQAARQAEEEGVTLQEELVRLVVHGTLHVLGHDHPQGEERLESPMFLLQEELVHQLLGAGAAGAAGGEPAPGEGRS